jgi:rSAM/selenodomain-associated transferase 1
MKPVSSEQIVIFSKSADAGTVKTRMRPLLDEERCLSLHLSLLQDTLLKLRDFAPVLYLSGSGNLPFDPGVPVRNQSGADLGERMMRAFQIELQEHSKVMIIGIDSPTLSRDQIRIALAALDHHDVVLGPSEDGGYYLLGLRAMVPDLFVDVPWGTSMVLTRTLEKISDLAYCLLEPCFDVDVPADLARLESELVALGHSDLEHVRKWMSDYYTLLSNKFDP